MPILGCLVTIERLLRRADREAEGARLLSEYAPKGHLGFESPALRQYEFEEGLRKGPFFGMENVSWGFEPERARALSKRESVCSPWAKSRQALKPEGMRSMPGYPQLSASTNLKKGPIWGPFLCGERRLGIRTLKIEAPRWTPHLVRCDIAPALRLGRLGYGLALGCERTVVDAATQAVELYQ